VLPRAPGYRINYVIRHVFLCVNVCLSVSQSP